MKIRLHYKAHTFYYENLISILNVNVDIRSDVAYINFGTAS